jgi:hypothetical protein
MDNINTVMTVLPKERILKICQTSPTSSGNTYLKFSSVKVLVAWGESLSSGNKGIYDYQYFSVGSHILTWGKWCHYWKGLHLTNWTTHADTTAILLHMAGS